MKLQYFLIITLIMVLAVSGCTYDDSDQTYQYNDSSYDLNSTPQTTTTPTNTARLTNTSSENKNVEVSGLCYKVIDGDTIDVEGVGRIRFVGVNTPERGESGYWDAKNFVKNKCLGKTVGLDIDDAKNKDKYGRTLAVVYVDGENLNQELLREGYAEVMYIPPSEFNPYRWS
ncbi:thermonuclease family protein [Methanobacterium petrolearium]|uniref:thermonuclease family protein n=1 Tax=Methanobacterium petrolearium TaxID=710190 RepID=UPI001AE21FA9|nr:thermonuclease family protein [Methanobacterium petrolearium]MBP1946447.1 micrococcal nuclease [Methanobacterium petrolearium]BDZ70525.1 thermonuclease [Methanobacterium petrolearium]